jgi:hypothetical protein
VSAKYLEYLYDALAQPVGTVIQTSNPELLRQKLYQLRRDQAPTFEDLAFLISPTNPDQLWIIHKHQPRAEEPLEPLDL